MKIYKSDARFKHHAKGLVYIVQFAWGGNSNDTILFQKLIAIFSEMYGPEREHNYASGYIRSIWTYNDNWRCEQNKGARRRRIYLRDEAALTMALLKAEA